MTAPDPGLTDLIATHTTNWERRCLGGDESYLQCDCGDEFEDELSWAAHLKLVVEQHTNGRITELEDGIMRAIHELIETRERAEKAEATIAKVRGEVSAYSEIIPAVALADLRAALEGEQQ